MSELKPCPFCGSTDVCSKFDGVELDYIECQQCHARSAVCHAPEENWNRRAPDPLLEEARELIRIKNRQFDCCYGEWHEAADKWLAKLGERDEN